MSEQSNIPAQRSALLCPLVGSFARLPGKVVVEKLPAQAALQLEPEPENPYDGNAIKVMVALDQIPEEQYEPLNYELMNHGYELEELLSEGAPIWIGYLAASEGKPLAKAKEATGLAFVGNREIGQAIGEASAYDATLGFGPDGKPFVSVRCGTPAEALAERDEQEASADGA